MHKILIKRCLFLLLFSIVCEYAFSQSNTVLQGVVKDSVTNEALPFVTVQFDNTSIGVFTDDNGKFYIRNRANKTEVSISFLGYKTYKITIPAGRTTTKEILLQPEDLSLKEVVIRPKKEKYSKKNNPAVDLINKVIARKDSNNVASKDYYQCREYDRILFALNDFKPNQGQFKRMKFLPNYVDTSIIDHRQILPFSVRETISDYYYRKKPKSEKRVVEAFDRSGIDNAMDIKNLESIINEVFKDISIYDNSMTFMMQDFISPLSSHSAVNFYRWYIMDTITMEDNKRYIDLAFAPFNSRDIGLTGNLYISTDSTFAVKRAVMKAPRNINMNFVDELIIRHDFKQTEDKKWIPESQRTAMDLSLYKAIKFHVDKTRAFDNYVFDQPADSLYKEAAPTLYAEDYEDKTDEYWTENRPLNYKDYKMDELVEDIRNISFFNFLINFGKLASEGYFHTSNDPDKNKLDIGTLLTFYSYNAVEGNRFRGTLATTPNFHPHLFLYGYTAYGTKDGKFKYYGEATWSFNKVKDHKDEFPRNNLMFAYKYDINDLGQRYTQSERDYIFMSLRSSNASKSTYNRQTQIAYQREYYNGFSYKISGQTYDERPAGTLQFKQYGDNNEIRFEDKILTTEAKLELRYAPNEKFFQQKRKRYEIPSEKLILTVAHTAGLKGVLGGMYDYNKTFFYAYKELWVAPYGKIGITLSGEKMWGEAPFPLLISPSANSSFTIQNGSFNLLEPLEFLHDEQFSWEINYRMGGWLLNRIPLLNRLKLREVFGFRGVMGNLNQRNDPYYNHKLLVFPEGAIYQANKTPYMEYNIGIENILGFFRIDYVRRLNYLDHPDVNKSGFRFSAEFSF